MFFLCARSTSLHQPVRGIRNTFLHMIEDFIEYITSEISEFVAYKKGLSKTFIAYYIVTLSIAQNDILSIISEYVV